MIEVLAGLATIAWALAYPVKWLSKRIAVWRWKRAEKKRPPRVSVVDLPTRYSNQYRQILRQANAVNHLHNRR